MDWRWSFGYALQETYQGTEEAIIKSFPLPWGPLGRLRMPRSALFLASDAAQISTGEISTSTGHVHG